MLGIGRGSESHNQSDPLFDDVVQNDALEKPREAWMRACPFPLPPPSAHPSCTFVGAGYPQQAKTCLRPAGDNEHDESKQPYGIDPENNIKPKTK